MTFYEKKRGEKSRHFYLSKTVCCKKCEKWRWQKGGFSVKPVLASREWEFETEKFKSEFFNYVSNFFKNFFLEKNKKVLDKKKEVDILTNPNSGRKSVTENFLKKVVDKKDSPEYKQWPATESRTSPLKVKDEGKQRSRTVARKIPIDLWKLNSKRIHTKRIWFIKKRIVPRESSDSMRCPALLAWKVGIKSGNDDCQFLSKWFELLVRSLK